MTKDWYIWETATKLLTAADALVFVNENPLFPVPSYDEKTGEINPNCPTEDWYPSVVRFTNGKCGFPKIPDTRLDHMHVSEQQRQYFLDTYEPSIEQREPSWVIIGDGPT